jgi:glycosyltransferase involved in cell wall biosynthesis
VIPVYNELAYLAACLDSVAAQLHPVDEVIVVDDGSTDGCTEIAARYDFVRILRQPHAGLIAARSHGFDAATGDILARIDADCTLEPDWSCALLAAFDKHTYVAGVAGVAITDLLPFVRSLHSVFFSWAYCVQTSAFFGAPIMWGANMAIRRQAWQKIRQSICLDDHIVHEDQDISLAMAEHGQRIYLATACRVRTSGQSIHTWHKLWEYTKRRHATRHLHAAKLPKVSARQRCVYVLTKLAFMPGFALFYTVSFVLQPFDSYRIAKR